jgi:hypothetical protein
MREWEGEQEREHKERNRELVERVKAEAEPRADE